MKKLVFNTITATSLLLASSAALSMPIVLDFEGVGDLAAVDQFYNGGTDSLGNSGVNHGIHFSANSLGIIDSDAGGSGNFANEPSESTILFWTDEASAIMNVAAGFDTGFSFFYSSAEAATINIWDGLDATGNLLGSIDLAAQHTLDCGGDPTGTFCNWTAVGVAFMGVAMSIDFGGTANFTGYDDVTFGSVDPGNDIPEPGSLALLSLGVIGLGAVRRKRILAKSA